jgi:metal-responsive CopG/Arc/MetJ family transcriptional regulator
MSSANWESIKIPKKLVEKIEKIKDVHGYASTMEFVRDAVRRRLEELEKPKIAENRRNGSSFVDADGDVEVFEGGDSA